MVISSRDIVRNVIFNEPTFKAYMYPRQIFIGNEKIPLSKQRMEITVHNGKLFLIITVIPVGGNNNQPKMISINFSQFRNITLKTFGNETDPPALIFHLAPASSYRILNALGDNLSNLLSSRATDLASQEYLKNTIIITLQEEPANPNENEERFMSFAINSNHQNQENAPKLEHFDMEQSFEIWKNEIQTKWTARFSERWRRTFGNQTMDFIDIIPENDFRQMMRAIGLMIKPGITQSLDYFYFDAKVKGINALFREINNYKPLEEILKLKAGEKRRAEPSPVKHGPLCNIGPSLHLSKSSISSSNPHYSISCQNQRNLYIRTKKLAENENEDGILNVLCKCKENYETPTKFARNEPPSPEPQEKSENRENSENPCEDAKLLIDFSAGDFENLKISQESEEDLAENSGIIDVVNTSSFYQENEENLAEIGQGDAENAENSLEDGEIQESAENPTPKAQNLAEGDAETQELAGNLSGIYLSAENPEEAQELAENAETMEFEAPEFAENQAPASEEPQESADNDENFRPVPETEKFAENAEKIEKDAENLDFEAENRAENDENRNLAEKLDFEASEAPEVQKSIENASESQILAEISSEYQNLTENAPEDQESTENAPESQNLAEIAENSAPEGQKSLGIVPEAPEAQKSPRIVSKAPEAQNLAENPYEAEFLAENAPEAQKSAEKPPEPQISAQNPYEAEFLAENRLEAPESPNLNENAPEAPETQFSAQNPFEAEFLAENRPEAPEAQFLDEKPPESENQPKFSPETCPLPDFSNFEPDHQNPPLPRSNPVLSASNYPVIPSISEIDRNLENILAQPENNLMNEFFYSPPQGYQHPQQMQPNYYQNMHGQPEFGAFAYHQPMIQHQSVPPIHNPYLAHIQNPNQLHHPQFQPFPAQFRTPDQPLVTVVKKLKIDKQLKPAKKVVLKMAGQKEEVSLSDDEASSSTSSGKIAKTTSTEGEDDMTYETQLFVFPPKSVEKQEYDSVVVCVKDIHTLARDEFINDVMISYKINYLINYQIDKSLRPKIYFFNTFFYSGLSKNVNTPMFSTKNGISESEKKKLLSNVDRVSKWTKKFDVFGKEYLVIPINEEFHWLVAIIVNPSGAIVETGENEEESRKKPKTWIVFLDPLTGLDPRRQKNMCSCIRYYLTGLYNKTKAAGMKFATEKPTIFDESRIEVIRPANLPVQNNYYDCGLFVLYFIEAFFCGLKPITVQDIPNMDWKNYYENGEEMADLMRDKLYNSALRLLDEAPRSRLQKHELRMKHGLSTEGTASRKHRRHSASNCLPRGKSRHSKYYIQHYSMSPPPKNLIDMPFFSNPRPMAKVPITRRVRQLRMPEEKFASMY